MSPLPSDIFKGEIATELTVVIPTLNEFENLALLLSDLSKQEGVRLEVLVADGGSEDNTCQMAENWACEVVKCSKGRARQMNSGARRGKSPFLVFIHADTRIKCTTLLCDALNYLRGRIEEKGSWKMAGHFPIKFIKPDGTRPGSRYLYLEAKSKLNRRNTTNGDQAFLMRREFFWHMQGFCDEFPFLEDQELAERIRQEGEWITLPGYIETSCRRFESEGFCQRYALMAIMMGLYHAGVKEFFYQAPDVYREQGQVGSLQLWPFFRLWIKIQLFDLGWSKSWLAWKRLGKYIRENFWQVFFFCDVYIVACLKRDCLFFLKIYDVLIHPMTSNVFFDRITMVTSFCLVTFFFTPLSWLSYLLTSLRQPLEKGTQSVSQ